MSTVNLTVNGRPVHADAPPRTHLADFLRETQNLTGTHLGCEHGVCGACTILVDGVPTRSCITLAVACENAEVTTIEGLDNDEIGAELRVAFSREHALQCGYCTPGMIVSARDLVLRLETPDEHEIRVAMSGNLCRCTGYVGIVRAVQSVIEARRERGIGPIRGANRARLGPAGSGHARAVEAAPVQQAEPSAVAAPSARPVSPGPDLDPDWKPKSSLRQSFVVTYPVEEVWSYFGRLGEVASCLPGASLVGEPQDGRVEGRIRVKVGPMTPEFTGVAYVTRDEEARVGTITGSGRDKRSNSSTRGVIRYALKAGENEGETRVDVDVGYTLTGMLAQFGRSDLVEDVAKRLTAAFVQNLEARLSHAATGGEMEPPTVVTELDAGSLLSSIVMGRIRSLFARLRGRK